MLPGSAPRDPSPRRSSLYPVPPPTYSEIFSQEVRGQDQGGIQPLQIIVHRPPEEVEAERIGENILGIFCSMPS